MPYDLQTIKKGKCRTVGADCASPMFNFQADPGVCNITARNVFQTATGLFAAACSSLIVIVFSGFMLGVQIGFLFACALYLLAGLAGFAASRHKKFFTGWLLWTAALGTYTGVVLFS
ncbi:hypothetical protein [Nonomuraea pusilla]|uniref:hypothetical protein n=1 Tax=Nonomuraea pusilla TaxID=46177 RepID=UPI001160AD22|nr:hypothetical protein [Nonomuraea pusilla]